MLTPSELHELLEELAHTRVLSVYLDTRVTDPAMRDAWRPTLQAGLRDARARITDDRELEQIDRAAALEVPKVDGASIYGGTPSDTSVIQAIRAIRSAGKEVMF